MKDTAGVYKKLGRWHAQISFLRCCYFLGSYETKREALEVIKKALIRREEIKPKWAEIRYYLQHGK